MPLGIVSDEIFEKEVNKEVIPKGEIKLPKDLGRGKDNINTPDSIRKLIGDNALTEGRPDTLELAEAFGVSETSVAAYSNGATSLATYNDKNNPLSGFLSKRREKIAKRASSAVLRAIEGITDEKLEAAKAIDLASIAKSLSGVVKDMLPDESKSNTVNNNTAVKLVVHVPQQVKETAFETITVDA